MALPAPVVIDALLTAPADGMTLAVFPASRLGKQMNRGRTVCAQWVKLSGFGPM